MTESAYVAGPMTGLPGFNFDLFDEISELCRKDHGWIVHNPHEHDLVKFPNIDQAEATKTGDVVALGIEIGFTLAGALSWDLARVAESEHIVMLPNWWKSTGARIERFTAEQTATRVWLACYDDQGWHLVLDPEQKRMSGVTVEVNDGWTGAPRVEGEDIERLEQIQVPRDGYDYPTTAEVLAGGQAKGTGFLTLDGGDNVRAVFRQPSTVVGLVGYAQVGKDTLAAQLVEKHGFQRIAFADVLRECLYALNPIIATGSLTIGYGPTTHHTKRLQDLVDAQGWDQVKVKYTEVRELLQRLGTEVGRNILGTDIWVETALKKVQPGGKYVITDVRFPNEFAAIEKLGGTTVRILREGHGPVNDHWSEKALDSYAADVTVWNVGTPQDLERIVADELNLLTKTWTKDGVPAPFGGRRALGVEA